MVMVDKTQLSLGLRVEVSIPSGEYQDVWKDIGYGRGSDPDLIGRMQKQLRIGQGVSVSTENYNHTLVLERTLALLPTEFPGRLELSSLEQFNLLEKIEKTGYALKNFRGMIPEDREAYLTEVWLKARQEASSLCPQFLNAFDGRRKTPESDIIR